MAQTPTERALDRGLRLTGGSNANNSAERLSDQDRTLGPAGESLRQAAGKAAERVKDAAGKAGERLKSAAEERGLTTEGLKEVAGEVTFTSAVSGKPDDQSRGTTAPQSPASSRGQSFEAGKDWSANDRTPGMARPDAGPRQGNR